MKNLLLLAVAMVSFNMTVAQTQVGAVTLPNTVNFGGESLSLNGAGIRKKAMVLKLYSAGLYLNEKSSDARAIMNADETMSEAVEEGFEASTGGNTAPLKSEIKKFIGFFSAEIVEDDTFDITYQKGRE